MGFSDEQIRDMLELKEELTEKIIKYKKQIEKLEKNISVLDTILKQSSFTKASDLTRNAPKTIKQVSHTKKQQKLWLMQLELHQCLEISSKTLPKLRKK